MRGDWRWGFCDRCGRLCELPTFTRRVSVCHDCELGMNSIAAALTPRWARPMTSAEIKLAHAWALIEGKQVVDGGAQ